MEEKAVMFALKMQEDLEQLEIAILSVLRDVYLEL